MKRIKSNHLWRRGATLLLAMLMLFTCVGSALPAFAEEAAGNTATVDSGDPVLADSSASGDSTGDTGTDLPDDPQRPTLPSGEDISEEAPPADESDGETVPPADSDSSEDPAAPDSGDSIPDESESEPAEQPGEGDADLPEDEQPSGEEPDPDEDEEIPENEPEDEPFEALVILDPENGAAVQAGVGEEVTFKAPVSREDVAVAYQWQRFQKPAAGSVQTEALYDYAEGETTEYWYALDDMREAEALAMNPDMLWPGIEMYYATVAALDEIGADSSDVSIAWKTPNFALEGYTISAAETESGIEVYADKDDERHVAHLNENSEWEFGEAEEKPETTGAWLNIEGANGPEYAFTVEERDYDASFRCEVTVLDEVYLEQCLSILEEQGIELTEEQRAAEQKLYSVVMSVENGKEEALPEDEPMTFSMARSMLRAAASGKPQLSADAQWIEGLDGNYQYITKDTYDRVSEWLAKGEITETQAARYWTYLRPNGYTGSTVANVLDENGKPTGTTRQYQGFDLTDGMLEVNSEWYGKTVYFRVAGSGGTGTAITIPAYTELETDENGNYIEGASGTKYKKAITLPSIISGASASRPTRRSRMAFTPCNSFERALMIGAQCSDLLRKPENTKHLINDNLIFLPSLRYHDDVNPFSDGNWLHRFFTMRFVYWDSQKILGLVIDNPEANGLGEFFDHSIYFQNSTDQDYDIDVWPTSCPWFSEIVANHSSITVQGLLKKERWNGTTAKDMEENFLYYVRSDIYGDVYSGLCLNNWLYGEEDRTFRRFSMAALQSTEDLMMAERLARSMCREIEKPIS